MTDWCDDPPIHAAPEPMVWWDDPEPLGMLYGPSGAVIAVVMPERLPIGFAHPKETR